METSVMEENKNITIIDVARRAGVSKGTVDRVLHNRGEVSAKSAEKVRQAIRDLDYEPNLYASLLATRKNHVIACLLPRSVKGEYWDKLRVGFEQGGTAASTLGAETRLFFYDQYDPESFAKACSELLATDPSGVVLPPLFKNDTILFTEKLHKAGIPYVYVDSRLEDEHYLAYFGMPTYRSGYLCAHLLTERCTEVPEVAVIRITRDKTRRSDPTIDRRAGFSDYMQEMFPDCEIMNVFINPNEPQTIVPVLEEFFAAHPDVKFVVMFNSRIHLVAPYLEAHPVEGRRVVGFDDLDLNMEALSSGAVTVLIAQHTEAQSSKAVATLVDYIVLHKDPSKRDNYMHMDILTSLNQDNY